MIQNSSESAKCSTCGSMQTAITDPESAEVICNGCGMVISDMTIATQETESRVTGSNGDGTSAPLSRHDRGLATIIGSHNVDVSGKKLDANTRLTFERLRTWDARTQIDSSTDKNLSRAFSTLLMLKGKLGLSNTIVEKTAYIYRKVVARRLVRGRTIPGMLAACLYLACREAGTPRTIKDIASKSNIKRKCIARSIRLVTLKLDIKAPIFDPMKCIAKISNTSKISEKTKRQAFVIMDMAYKREIPAGKDPMGLAASVLYIACKETAENKTQHDMAKAAGVTEVTIRNRVRDLGENLELSTV
jgi:transcription initiation factor TFIIB